MVNSHDGPRLSFRPKDTPTIDRAPKTSFDGTKLPVVVTHFETTTYGMRSPFSDDLSASVLRIHDASDAEFLPPTTFACSISTAACRAATALILSDWSVIPSLPENLKPRRRFLSFFHSSAGAMLTLLKLSSIESLGPARPHQLIFLNPKGAV
jgi:hypothetical protein